MKRKILIYRNELLNLSETFILSQVNALKRFQPVLGGVRRIKPSLSLEPHPVRLISVSDAWKEKARRRVFLRTGYAGKFLHAGPVDQIEMIHAHFAIDACAVLPIAKRLRIPLVVTLHGYDVSCGEEDFHLLPTTRAYLRRKKELWQYAGLFLCVSEHVRQRAIEKGFPAGKLFVHHVGTRRAETAPEKCCHRQPIILFVGRLVEKKGCIHLIRAMPRILKEVPDAQLIILGDGPLKEMLEQEAKPWRKNVSFQGHLPHTEVMCWMRHARVLAAPSIRAANGDEEGLPTVLCEAQSLGLPAVAFKTSGVVEAFPEQHRSDMPQEGDEAGLSERIVQLLQDNAAWEGMSVLGKKYMNAQFDLEKQTRILEDKYEEVISNYCK